jgi:crotonobetainyl-CoA:carnitine CoA-transferase CaiB-like acyl-CoA transferase
MSCSIKAYGDTGPMAARPGFDPLMQAEGGMMAAQGGDDDPVLYTIAVNDIATAAVVAASVTAALNARDRTGEGQEVVSSLLAQSLLFQLDRMVDYPARPPNPQGGRDCLGVSALTRYYACADGWLGLACDTDAEAQGVGRALGVGLGAAPLLETRDGPLAQELEAVLAARSRDATVDALIAEGVPSAPVRRFEEALDDPWLMANGMTAPWTHPRLGPVVSARAYADFGATPAGFSRPTPDLGEHSDEVLTEYGIAADRIVRARASGAVFG